MMRTYQLLAGREWNSPNRWRCSTTVRKNASENCITLGAEENERTTTNPWVHTVSENGVKHIFKGVFGTVRTEAYRRYLPPVLPVPDSSASSVRHQYRYRTLRYVRYDINTGTGYLGKFGTISIPVPDTLVSSVRHQYRYLRHRYGRLYRS